MSILHLVRCEQYETCKHEFSFGTNTLPGSFAPDDWITLFEGNPRTNEGYNFCSKECLAKWLRTKNVSDESGQPALDEDDDLPDEFLPFRGKCLPDGRVVSLADGTIYIPEPPENPDCKARRFLLVDGETAEFTEGVKWANGTVTLEAEISVCGRDDFRDFPDWEEFRATNEGSGVQWIDKEVPA